MEMSSYFLLVLVGSFALPISMHAQDQTGFISLDCGLPEDLSYSETTRTGIKYTSDAAYVETGRSESILPEFQSRIQRQMWTVRSFPGGERNCYNLILKKDDRFLIRAGFMYGNYDKKNEAPQFDLYLGPNLWTSVALTDASTPMSFEIIHTLQSNHLYVCLVNTGNGTPFISVLELRPLKNTTYESETGSMELVKRFDAGSTTEAFRFNKDVYDRFWVPYNRNDWAQVSTASSVGSHDDYQPPSIAMMTAVTPADASKTLDFYLDTPKSDDKFYAYMYFAEFEANVSRVMNVYHNGLHKYGPFTPRYLNATTLFTPKAWEVGQYAFFSISRAEGSTLPPIINAFEIYKEKKFPKLQTAQRDVDCILNIKSTYGLMKSNWQGDPCAPYLWEGLDCRQNDNDQPRIISLNLSSSGLTGEIPSCIANLTEVQYLDLSKNSLTGSVPEFLSQLQFLTVLNLEANMLNGSVPAKLIKRSENGLQLRVKGNPNLCASISCKKKTGKGIAVPIAVSASSLLALIIALAILWRLKSRKLLARERDGYRSSCLSLEPKNRRVTYSEILKITNNFEKILGKGSFGMVFHGYFGDTQVAVKMLSPQSVQGYKEFEAEVTLLLRVHHKSLTSLIGYCYEGTYMGLIYEYMAEGNLAEHLSESSNHILSWEQRLQIMLDAASGLEYLHNGCKPPIIHRDVKSRNILLNENFQAKMADFGLSKTFTTEAGSYVSTVVAGTPGYLDPEYYLTNRLSEKSDIYSFGVLLLEVITTRPVIANTTDKTHISQWVNFMLSKGDIKRIVDPRLKEDFDVNSAWKAVEVAIACVSPTSTGRPTMKDVVGEIYECLATERARKKIGHENGSQNSAGMFTVNLNISSEMGPFLR
ncbi:hypothetical protein SLEP1_g52527 [Rubroshorea leprosula]|uniref:non-specific serine/threonine protein kinase n=1 Tax=Rubroshorea leprosula TaxID=152421 RepID=A0AAV5M6Q3_9ROSI|nr:hypothetical protein SLEP1_g52527 [Rubroshorea leprosula]